MVHYLEIGQRLKDHWLLDSVHTESQVRRIDAGPR